MSDINWPIGENEATEAIDDANSIGFYQNTAVAPGKKQRRMTLQAFRVWLADNLIFLNGRKFFAGRIDSRELTSGTLTVTGWYTIAQADAESFQSSVGDFVCIYGVGSLSCHAEVVGNAGVKDKSNTTIQLKGYSGAILATSSPQSFRVCKSDGVDDAGFLLQVYIDATINLSLLTLKTAGTGREISKGWELTMPVLDNAPTLPDTITAATFLEAGADLIFDKTAIFYNIFTGRKNGNDAILCCINANEIPKQGTGLTIINPALIALRDGTGASAAALGSFTISSFEAINANMYQFQINQTGIATALTADSNITMRVTGTIKFTIT